MLRKSLSSIIKFILTFWVIIDLVNGIFFIYFPELSNLISFGMAIRVVVWIFLFIKILHSRKHIPILSTIFLIIILTFDLLLRIMFYNENSIIGELQMNLKITMPILFFFVIQDEMKNGRICILELKKILYFNLVVIIVNVILGILGIGFSRYNTNISFVEGGQGFFYSGNEMNATFILISGLMLGVGLLEGYKHSKLTWIWIFMFLISSLMFSKTAIIGTIIILFLVWLNKFKKPLYILKQGLILLSILGLSSPFWSVYIKRAVERWRYFIDYAPNLFSGVSSSRIDRFPVIIDLVKKNKESIIWGLGPVNSGFVQLEMDFIDQFWKIGIIGLFVPFYFWFIIIKNILLSRRYRIFLIGLYVLILMIAVLSGHVIESAMIAPFLAILGNMKEIKINEKK